MKDKFIYIILGVCGVFILLTFMYVTISRSPSSNLPQPVLFITPTPTKPLSSGIVGPRNASITPLPPIPGQSKSYQESVEEIARKEQAQVEKDSNVGVLLPKLPFTGQNFSLSYKISTNQFVLTLFKGQEEDGNKEFDQFLKENDIAERSWLYNLNIEVK